MKKILISLIFLSFLSASNINLQITNSTIGIFAETSIIEQQNFKARGMFLYNDESGKNNFYFLGVKAEGNLVGINYENLKFSLITDFVHTKHNSAVALGVGVYSLLPNLNIPISLRAEAEYAPDVLSFDEAKRFSRIDVNIGYSPIVNAEIFVGYRDIRFDNLYNSSAYVGIGYNF